MKTCPFCAEEIQSAAVKCKHCFEFLDGMKPPPLVYGQAVISANPVAWYFRTGFIVMTFLMIPPFALPLILGHPKLNVVWKLVLSAAVVAVCWGMYWVFREFVNQFEEATKMMNGLNI